MMTKCTHPLHKRSQNYGQYLSCTKCGKVLQVYEEDRRTQAEKNHDDNPCTS